MYATLNVHNFKHIFKLAQQRQACTSSVLHLQWELSAITIIRKVCLRKSRCLNLFAGISDIFQAVYPQHSFCGENHHCVLVGLLLLTTYLQTVSSTTATYASWPERRKDNSCTMHTIHGEKKYLGQVLIFMESALGTLLSRQVQIAAALNDQKAIRAQDLLFGFKFNAVPPQCLGKRN